MHCGNATRYNKIPRVVSVLMEKSATSGTGTRFAKGFRFSRMDTYMLPFKQEVYVFVRTILVEIVWYFSRIDILIMISSVAIDSTLSQIWYRTYFTWYSGYHTQIKLFDFPAFKFRGKYLLTHVSYSANPWNRIFLIYISIRHLDIIPAN